MLKVVMAFQIISMGENSDSQSVGCSPLVVQGGTAGGTWEVIYSKYLNIFMYWIL